MNLITGCFRQSQMQESNLCRRLIPENSYNCWGGGIYGTTVTRFDSYDDAIETVGKGLKKTYIDKGLVTACDYDKYTPHLRVVGNMVLICL